MGEPLTIEAFHAMAEKLRPKPTTPLEEGMVQRPILILKADVEGVLAVRIVPGKAVFVARNPEEIAGKLRQEGLVVATGRDAREIAASIAQTSAMVAWASGNPLLVAAIEHHQAIDKARVEIEVLRDIVGAEQVELVLWWAGPDLARLGLARSYLAEGQTIDGDGRWWSGGIAAGAIRALALIYLQKRWTHRDPGEDG